jgi:hydroxymethylglutaryl-CoA reductase/dihydroflavonol-4-reductase
MSETSEKPVQLPAGKILVTGGSGHVGANLVRRLLADGHDVRCLEVSGTNNRGLDDLDVERVAGDIRDRASVDRVMDGVARVFHVAAKVSTMTPNPREEREIWEINVLGTRNVMRSALAHDVKRVVLTGSFSSVGFDPDDPSAASDESKPFFPFIDWLPYARSKVLAELETYKAIADGLDAVIATSCAVFGPHDYLPSRLGRVLCDYCNGQLRAHVPGGFDFVNVHDLVEGHVLAMERGKTGQKYIFSTEFMTMDEMLSIFGEISGRHRKTVRLPPGLVKNFANAYYRMAARFFPNVPQRMTPGAIEILTMYRRADTGKAQRELGYRPTSIRDAIREAYEFFVAEGKIKGSKLSETPNPRSEIIAAKQ